MKKYIIIISVVFFAACALLFALSPDFLSMIIIGIMGAAIAVGMIFGIIRDRLVR